MDKKKLKDLNMEGKKVLVRVDFNVPLNADGSMLDDTRIEASLPTIHYILDHGGAIILMSHLGRPKQGFDEKLSLKVCADRLAQKLGCPVMMAPDCVGPETEKMARKLKPGQILLLENLRFHEGEEKPEQDPTFAKKLASLGDLYVNDAFGTAHRYHSSTAAITKYFPEKAAMGLLMEKEVLYMQKVLSKPDRPFYAILGGAKISTKLGVLKALLSKVDAIFIGGGMAFTFLKARGLQVGQSLVEDAQLAEALDVMHMARKQAIPFYLPVDIVAANKVSSDASVSIVNVNQGIPQDWQGCDIGPETINQYVEALQTAKTVFWNGPMGIFENPLFATGTMTIAKALSQLKATTIVGGGESVAAVEQAGVAQLFSHLSTGGGATLEFIEFGKLPGIEALTFC